MILPNDDNLREELAALSAYVFDCIGLAGVLGPTLTQWDEHRDPELVSGRSLLRTFGLPDNASGWATMLDAYGFQAPTYRQCIIAHHTRMAYSGTVSHDPHPEDEFLTLHGSSVREEVTYAELEDGTTVKITRTYTSLR